MTDVEDLQTRAQELGANTRNKADKDGYQPDEVANGAVALLGEVQASKITGEEERYSHIDLLDFAANVEGSQQAFAALKPALDQIDPTVVPAIARSSTRSPRCSTATRTRRSWAATCSTST